MKYIIAALVATLAAAAPQFDMNEDVEFHAEMSERAVEGQKHVDLVVDDPYSLSGISNVHGGECMHAIGHDGTYHYVRMVPNEDFHDDTNSSGDYLESTTIHNGKHIYVNFEKDQFMVFNNESWVLTTNDQMKDILAGRNEAKTGLHFGEGPDKPEHVEGYYVSWETDMDLEPEWRCLMRPLLVQAVGYVEQAELSIESKALLEEKRELVEVHKRLVEEAEDRKAEADCIEIIEKAMAALEECELQVLRNYVGIADTYPQSWLQLLKEKVVCVDTFARATASCNHLWTDQWDRYYG